MISASASPKCAEAMPPPPGKRPGKRAMELIRFYLMGYVGFNEVMALPALEKTK